MKAFLSVAIPVAAVLALAGCAPQGAGVKTANDIRVEGTCSAEDVRFFDSFYTSMIRAVEAEDLEKSLAFYSEGFKGQTPEQKEGLRRNTAALYANYKNIVYSPESIRLVGGQDEAMTTDDYSFNAIPEDVRKFKPLNYSGRERMYWKKENGAWKIVDWIYY
jgi:hypothetical protein